MWLPKVVREAFTKDIHSAFKSFTDEINDDIKWLPAELSKHEGNQRLYLNNISHCFTKLMTNGSGMEADSHNIDTMVKNLFLLKFSRGLIK